MGNLLQGKVALITASNRGIGRAIADAYIDEGATVYFAVRNARAGKKAAEEAIARGGKAGVVHFQAEDYESHEKMIDEVLEKEGRLDILVNNYGGSNPMLDRDIVNSDWNEFISVVERHLATVHRASKQAIVKAFIPQNSGCIINIGSVAGVVPDLTQCGYGVSKAAIEHFTRQMAQQLGRYNIRANVLLPGITATDAVRRYLPKNVQDQILSGCVIKRLAEPSEMAALAVYLGSDGAAYVTGQAIKVSGGYDFCAPAYAYLDAKNN